MNLNYRDDADLRDAIEEGHTLRVDRWYDRSWRSWRTMVVDERGYQVGTAAYDGTRADAEASARLFTRAIEEAARG